MKICVEMAGDLTELIDRQAAIDGHQNRAAVVRKALNVFLAGGSETGQSVAAEPTTKTDPVIIGVDLPDELVYQINRQAKYDGHSNRGAVVRKAVMSFFVPKVAFVASKK